MWLRRINDSGEEFRYELIDGNIYDLMLEDGSCTKAIMVVKYWKNNDGKFQRVAYKSSMYVSMNVLLSQFVLIDSNVDKELKDLGDFKNNTYAKRLDESLKPFCFDESDATGYIPSAESGPRGS